MEQSFIFKKSVLHVFLLTEALHLANQLCQYGYFFPVSDSKNLVVKDDSSLYRFQVNSFKTSHSNRLLKEYINYCFVVSLLLAVAEQTTWKRGIRHLLNKKNVKK